MQLIQLSVTDFKMLGGDLNSSLLEYKDNEIDNETWLKLLCGGSDDHNLSGSDNCCNKYADHLVETYITNESVTMKYSAEIHLV